LVKTVIKSSFLGEIVSAVSLQNGEQQEGFA